jgi:4-hydroxy-tetrahydrodipicolinate synthase
MHPLAGVYSAAVTPLKQDFSPDLEAIPSLLDFLAGRGCHGILLLGTTGEGPSFSPEERLGILRVALQARGMLRPSQKGAYKILAGTGTPSLTETIALTRSAFELGCEAVVVLPPYYYRKATETGLFHYFSELIQMAVPSDGFLLGYHIPGTTGIGFSTDLLARLKDAFPNQFAGIKDSSHNIEFVRQLGECFGSDLLVLTGTDSLFQTALENHAQGCITAPANLISPELRQIWDAFQRGEDVSEIQSRVTEIRQTLEKYPPFPPILKALLAKQHGFPRWPVRPPLEEASPDAVEKVLEEIKAAS